MADNKALPLTGSGDATATVATDEIAGIDYQKVKLVDGTADSTTVIAAGGGVEAGALRVTLASDSTGVVSVDDNGASLTVDNAHLTTLGGAIAGTEVQVDVVAALPAGTNNIGDIDVLTVPAPLSTTGGGTEATALRVTVANDSTGVLSVDDNGSSLTVDGTVTANAGTNLNTSALALESGGNLAAVAASASVLDDWDESDRAKVNPIAGQAGVQGGSGAVTALTQRVVLATDVALPAGTNAIGKLAANSGVDIGDVDVLTLPGIAGTVAHDGADSGNPVKIGGKARTTNPTAVADADRVDATFDDLGRQVVVLNQVRDLVGHQHTQIASSAAETTIVTTVASTLLDLVALVITNQTATAVNVTIKDGTGGTTRMILALAASGGIVLNFPVPVTQSAAGNWTATLSSAAVTVNIFAQFVKNV